MTRHRSMVPRHRTSLVDDVDLPGDARLRRIAWLLVFIAATIVGGMWMVAACAT